MNKAKEFCTCADHECPLNPVNNEYGCDLCVEKNLKLGEIPSCFWNQISTRKERQEMGCNYTQKEYAAMVMERCK